MKRGMGKKINSSATLLSVLLAWGQVGAALAASGRTELTVVVKDHIVVNMAAANPGKNARQNPSTPHNLVDMSGDGGSIGGSGVLGSVSVFRTVEHAGVGCPMHAAGGRLHGFETFFMTPGTAPAAGAGPGRSNCRKHKAIRINVYIL